MSHEARGIFLSRFQDFIDVCCCECCLGFTHGAFKVFYLHFNIFKWKIRWKLSQSFFQQFVFLRPELLLYVLDELAAFGLIKSG